MLSIQNNHCNNTTILDKDLSGNIIPHSWYSKILSKSGRPDHIAIAIYSEIVYWYKPDKSGKFKFPEDLWQTSYEFFEKKFGYNRQAVRRALIRLEELGRIKRIYRTITKFGQKYPNVLFIEMIENSYISISHNNNSSKETISPEKKEKNFYPSDDRGNYESDTALLQICSDQYKEEENKKENNIKIRSDICASARSILSYSSLEIEKNFSHNEPTIYLNEIVSPSIDRNEENKKEFFSDLSITKKSFLKNSKNRSKPKDWEEGRVLSELSGISEEDRNILNESSGRKFNLNFLNQFILKLGVKCPGHKFFRKEQFMNYIIKSLKHEITQESDGNNEDFTFSCVPQTEEQKYIKRVNKYLSKIEASTDRSPEITLQKKIIGRFDLKTAYEILNGTSLTIVKEKVDNYSTSTVCNELNSLSISSLKTLNELCLNNLEYKPELEYKKPSLFESNSNRDHELTLSLQNLAILQGERLQKLYIKILRPLRLNTYIDKKDKSINDLDCNIYSLGHENIATTVINKVSEASNRTTEIPEWIIQILFEEAQNVYGNTVCEYSISVNTEFSDMLSNYYLPKTSKIQGQEQELDAIQLNYDKNNEIWTDIKGNVNSVWNHVNKRLVSQFGLDIYKSWFSKINILDAELEVNTSKAQTVKEVKIQADTSFVRDWIKDNYRSAIGQAIKCFCPNLQLIEFVC